MHSSAATHSRGNWKQLLLPAVLAFLVPVLIIVAVVQIVMGGLKIDRTSGAMSEEAIAERLKPVGEVNLTPIPGQPAAAPASPPAAGAAPRAAEPASTATSGDAVYQQACAMCHATGLAGAPKTGDASGWKPRLAKGKDTLYEHALKGFNTMPAKGGNASLSDAQVKAAVDYLVGQVK
jgi:cytochrome c5